MVRALVVLLLCVSVARADVLAPVRLQAKAVRRTGSITIDGKLDEPAWAAAPQHTGFSQRFPKDQAKPTYETTFAVLFDDDAVYVGVWCDDPEPARIRRFLTRRDNESPSDEVAVAIDSYRDRRTAYMFELNAAGVQIDELLYDDVNSDTSWDAVWTGDTAVTAKGWTAEFRIPLSQLRFPGDVDAQQWGFQVIRAIGRNGEQDTWSPWPRNGPAIVSKFGDVTGIEKLRRQRRLELLPYVLGGVDLAPVDTGDPVNHHVNGRYNAGLDIKYGLGPAFTISATINPDFGQVEADPSVFNLSGSEIFFAEKRPFFLEGSDLFHMFIGNNDGGPEGAFYSRRIGAAPPLPDTSYDYVHAPQTTAIYGAAKLTGKQGPWSVGVLDAVTGPESEDVAYDDGTIAHPTAEPLTNYMIARVKRDFRDGKSSVGVSATAVDRKLDGTGLEGTLRDQAYTAGASFDHRWDNNAWEAHMQLLGSWVHGSRDAITALQEDMVHLYQRPDMTDHSLDPNRTSLAGDGFKLKIGRIGDVPHWRYGFGTDMRSPGLELNDAGFQTSSDRMTPFLFGEYHDNDPGETLLNYNINADVYSVMSWEPRVEDLGLESNTNIQFANFWSMYAYTNFDRARWLMSVMRGGAPLREDTHYYGVISLTSDTRKVVYVNATIAAGHTPKEDEIDGELDLGVTVQARSNLDVYAGPTVSWRNDPLQYIDQEPDETGKIHYIFGRIDQTTAAMTVRANWTFSPHLTLQVYAQPFITAGAYSELKDIDHPDAADYHDRYHLLTSRDVTYNPDDGDYHASYHGGYAFAKPDFAFRQLRSTVVLRWEYRPGSTIFAIWSHGRTSELDGEGHFELSRDLRGLADADQENVFMVKANYWFGL
ncbi:MAG TPA: DUF5916 domain-containing protein [Kofleriaceae bacterium]|jgi:hypothetical protein